MKAIACATSGTAIGLISNGISFFLLIYYSQVLGLDPALAGLALMISLIVDAVSDPLVGRWSDQLRSRLGRRHPFLFAAILPIPLAYYFVWATPELEQAALFTYLLTLTLILRLSVTIHVVPFAALIPEIARSYDARTQLQNYWYSSSWFVGTIMAVAMYAYWLADEPGSLAGSGMLRSSGYVEAGLVAAIAVFVCLLIATLGTQRYIPLLSQAKEKPGSLRELWQQSSKTLADGSFAAIAFSGFFTAAASGTSTALWAYMQPYFWGFNSSQTSVILAAQLLSAVLAFVLTPMVSRGKEKKTVLIQVSIFSIFVGTGPVFLTLIGLFPDHGQSLFYTMVVLGVLQVMLVVMSQTLFASMLADIVEARELVTGRREEGLLVSVQSFIGKASTGVGVWVGGVMLALVEFPLGASTADVDAGMIQHLGWLYAPSLTVFYILSIVALKFYTLDRAAHEKNLAQLGGTP